MLRQLKVSLCPANAFEAMHYDVAFVVNCGDERLANTAVGAVTELELSMAISIVHVK